MKIATYIKTAAVGFLQVANYRTEVWFMIAQRVLVLAGIVLLWSVVGKNYNTGQTFLQLIAYFLVANGVRELVDGQYGKFGSKTVDDIKSGAISSVLLQPTHTVIFLYFKYLGTRGVGIAFSIISIVVGIAMAPPSSVLATVMFVLVVVTASVISLAQCTMVGSLAFWITEAKGIKNVINHISKVFSGALVPLTFFPDSYQKIVILNPFASYGYLPATLLQTKTVDSFLFLQIGMSVFWAVSLALISRWIWKKGIKRYEAVGI